MTALLAVAFGALLSRFAREKLSNRRRDSDKTANIDQDRLRDAGE